MVANNTKLEEVKQLLITKILHYLGYSDRTEFEIRNKLQEYVEQLDQSSNAENDLNTVVSSQSSIETNSFDNTEVIDSVISRLYDLNLINDAKLAQRFINSKLTGSRPVGRRTIYQLLKAKGVASNLIETAFEDINPELEADSLEKLFSKKHKTLNYSYDLSTKKKLITYLLGRGCSPDAVYSLVDSKFKVK